MSTVIRLLIYGGLLYGIILATGDWIYEFYESKRRQKVIDTRIRSDGMNQIYELQNKYIHRLGVIVDIAHQGLINIYLYLTLLGVLFFGIVAFLAMSKNISLITLMSAFIITSLPIMFTFLKYYLNKIEASYEGEALLIEFANQYSMSNGNIREAVDRAGASLRREPHSKRALNRLSFGLKNARNYEEMELAIDDFGSALGTNWGLLLAQNIRIALQSDIDISDSLRDIVQEVKYIKDSIEKSSRENNEPIILIKFIAPLTFVFTTFFAMRVTETTINDYITQQFMTPIGFILAVSIITLYSIGIAVTFLLKRPKFE